MRPTYESDVDRNNEKAVADRICAAWKCTHMKMKPYYAIDYALVQDKRVVSLMEVKCRNYAADRIEGFGGLILSAHKMSAARMWRDLYDMPFVLAVGLTDGLYTWVSKPSEEWPRFRLEVAGRHDRGDWQDVEPCCLISMKMFTKWD